MGEELEEDEGIVNVRASSLSLLLLDIVVVLQKR